MSSPAVRDLRYKTSRDYAALWELAHEQSVACIVDHKWVTGDEPMTRDICQTRVGGLEVEARARIIYARGSTAADFADSCGRVNLEWIVPAKVAKVEDWPTQTDLLEAADRAMERAAKIIKVPLDAVEAPGGADQWVTDEWLKEAARWVDDNAATLAPPEVDPEVDPELDDECPDCDAAIGEPCRIPSGALYRDRHQGSAANFGRGRGGYWVTRYHASRGGRLTVSPQDRAKP